MRRAPRSSRYLLAVLGVFCALGLASGGPALAQDLREDGSAIIYNEVIIPDATPPGQTIENRVEYFTEGKVVDLAQYLNILYNFLISIAGLLATVMMIVGGIQYLTSAGDASKIGAAKSRMTNALMGLLLVLGAYTILKTINPELIKMKSLTVKSVATEVKNFPWCEELMKVGEVITPLKGTDCGGLGEYKSGNATAYCAYYGNCRIAAAGTGKALGARNQVATCMQVPGLTPENVQAKVAQDPDAPFAQCVACGFITDARAKELGYVSMAAACSKWMSQVTIFRKQDSENNHLWTFCTAAPSYQSCIQANIDCRAVNDNDDGNNSNCDGDKSHSCGCEGYDESPEPYWSTGNKDGFQQPNFFESLGSDELEDHEPLLAKVCQANPCKDFVDSRAPQTETVRTIQFGGTSFSIRFGPRSFIDGCKGESSFAGDLTALAQGDVNFPDCRNNPPAP